MDFNMEKKYKLTDETIKIDGHILHRIQALKDFNDVKKGDLGGFVEKEENLSHYGTCWIYNDACVYENAKVTDDAHVRANAKVRENACIYDKAIISGLAEIYGSARIWDQATVKDYAKVYQGASIHMHADIYENANIFGQASIWSNANVGGNANIYGNAYVCNNADIAGHANIYGHSIISENSIINEYAEICGNVEITGEAEIRGNVKVCQITDYIVFKNFWSSGRYFTWTRSNNMWKVGCFYGTGEELIKRAYRDSKKSGKEYERIVKYVESTLADEKKTKSYLIQMKMFLNAVMRSIKRFGEKTTEKLVSGESDKKFIRFFMVFAVIILLWYTVLAIFVWN